MKERLLGAAVLILAAVLIIPAVLDGPQTDKTVSTDLELPVPDTREAVADPVRSHTVAIGEPGPMPEGRQEPPTAEPVEEPGPPAPVPPVRRPAADGDAPAVTLTPASASGWAVQVGSFTSETNARRLVELLKDAGYPAFVLRGVVNGRVMFRVRVGPEPDKARAEALAERLRADRQQTQLVSHP